jgi:hypothetical protein
MDELARRVTEEFVPALKALPGFKGYYVVDCGGGVVTSISIFEDRDAAMQSNDRARDFVAKSMSDFMATPPEIASGEARVAVTA